MSATPADARLAAPAGRSAGRDLAQRAIRGTGWTAASQLTGKLLFFASTVVLARLLSQDDFGVAAYAITLIALFNAVPGLGLGAAIIHFRDEEDTLSTGFWLGLFAGVAGFALLWSLAPLAEHLFGDPRAVSVTRVLALVFPIDALRNVHATLLRKKLAFHRRFMPELLQATIKGAVSIALAFAGFGAWALIGGAVSASIAGVPAYWLAAGWRPRLRFEASAVRRLLPFGAHVVSTGLLGALVRNLDYLLVGRWLGAAALGVYVLAFRIPDLLIRNLSVMLGQVLLPLYARVKDEPLVVREAFLMTTSYVFALTAPMAVGLAIVAEPLVLTLFSEKWIDVVPVIPAICVYALVSSVSFNLGDLYKALGRPDILTRLSLLRLGLAAPAIAYAAGVVGTTAAVGWAQACVALVATTVNLLVAQQLFGLPVRDALSRLAPVGVAVAVMAFATLAIADALATQSAPLRLLLCSSVGAAVYVLALRLLARHFVDTALGSLRESLSRRRGVVEAEA